MSFNIKDIIQNILNSLQAQPLLEDLRKYEEEIENPSKDDDAGKGASKDDEKITQEALAILKSTFQIFKFSTGWDKFIMFIGSIFAFIHGSSFPILAMLIGGVSETFVVQSFQHNHNSSDEFLTSHSNFSQPKSNISASDIMNKLMGGNTTGKPEVNAEAVFGLIGSKIGSFGPQKPLSKEEFLDYANELSIICICIGAVVFISSFIQTVCWELAADNQAYRIRQKFLYQVLRQEIQWFDTWTAGNLIVKLADDVERIREGIGHKFSIVLEYTACFAVGAFFGLSTSWKLALIFGTSVPFILTKALFNGGMISTKSMEQQNEYGFAGAKSMDTLTSMKTVTAFGTVYYEKDLYESELDKGVDKALKRNSFIGVSTAFLYIIIYGSYAIGFYYACNQLMDHSLSPKQIYTVFFSVSIGVLALTNVLEFVPTVASAFASCQIIMGITDSVPKIDHFNQKGRQPKKVAGKLKFQSVNFRYPARDDITVIHDLTLLIKAGEYVAIVGQSGSGKSTLVNLLMRFYDAESGHIFFDDADLTTLNVSWLRDQIGVVQTSPVFEEGTIFENLCGDKENVLMEDVENAAKMACADEFINKFPEKYYTVIGVAGQKLTIGQRQRLAIARILIKNPPVLILDEATSGLTIATARKIHDNIKTLRSGRTTISVSHRLSHIQQVDAIYVLKEGEIVETGTHEELMENKNVYFKMSQDEKIEEALESKPEDGVPGGGDSQSGEHETAGGIVQESAIDVDIDVDCATYEFDAGLELPSRQALYDILTEENLWGIITKALIGAAVSGIIIPLFALVFSELFITFSETGHQFFSDAIFWMAMILILGVASAFGIWWRSVYVSACGEYLTKRLRAVVFMNIIRQHMGWFDEENHSEGRLYTRLASDAPFVKVAIGTRLGTAISACVTILCAIIISFFLEWQLGALTMIPLPFLLLFIYFQAKTYENHHRTIAKNMENSIRLAKKSVENIWTIQALNKAHHMLRKFVDAMDPAFKETRRQSLIYSLLFSLTEGLAFLLFATVLRLGAYLIFTADVDSIFLFKTFIVFMFAAISLTHVTSFIQDFVKAKFSFAHIYSLYELESKIDILEEDGETPPYEGRIAFENVVFSYPLTPNDLILKGVSFELEPGTCLGIIGLYGGGKSTILSLLERFYDVTSGSVKIDGVDIRSRKLDYTRYGMGFVAQEPRLFNRTISENIIYGFDPDEDVDVQAAVKEAADYAYVTEFVNNFPDGFDTKIGEQGCRLTAGQRSRVAIARALIRDPKILLLDEPTLALDPDDEALVQKALEKAKVGRTVIITSNRPSTIRTTDKVAVLVGGKIAEFGTHEELEGKKGYYHNFMKAGASGNTA